MIRLCSSTLLRRKISKRKKRKKKKVFNSTGGKMRCNIFLKKVWAFFAFHAHSFFKKPFMGQILSAHFSRTYTFTFFFFIFCRGSASYFLTKTLENCARSYDNDTNRKEGRAKTVVCPLAQLREKHTTVRCDGSVQTASPSTGSGFGQ